MEYVCYVGDWSASGLTDVALHQLIPPFTVDAQIIAKVADTTTIHRPTAAAL